MYLTSRYIKQKLTENKRGIHMSTIPVGNFNQLLSVTESRQTKINQGRLKCSLALAPRQWGSLQFTPQACGPYGSVVVWACGTRTWKLAPPATLPSTLCLSHKLNPKVAHYIFTSWTSVCVCVRQKSVRRK